MIKTRQDTKTNAENEDFLETLLWLDTNDRNEELKNK